MDLCNFSREAATDVGEMKPLASMFKEMSIWLKRMNPLDKLLLWNTPGWWCCHQWHATYPFSPPPCSQGLKHHTRDVSVWVDPHSSPEIFFPWKNVRTYIQVLQSVILWYNGIDGYSMNAIGSSIVTQGCSIREVYLMEWAPRTSICMYPFSPPPCSQGLGSSIGG